MREHPGMETPGGKIRAAREGRGMSLPELSEQTKIPPPVLEAIERDEYHKVSGALYIKSFLRSCAAEVGLDPDELLDLYSSFSGETKPNAAGGDVVWEEDQVEISHLGMPWRNLALIGGGLVVVGALVLVLGRGCRDSEPGVAEPTVEAVETELSGSVPNTTNLDEAIVEDDQPAASEGDTLVGAWQIGAESDRLEAVAEQQRPVGATTVAQTESNSESRPDAAVTSSSADDHAANAPAAQTLPLPLVGGPNLMFADGRRKPVVVRVICERQVGVRSQRDAEQGYENAVWPPAGVAPPPLPVTGIEAGRVYSVRRGSVVYWGAEDHISLSLDRTDGVEVTVNGRVRNIRNMRPGGEIILDDHQN